MKSNTLLPHIAEDVLELYAMGRLSEPETEPVEEHLLVCSVCQDALQETDNFVRAMRVAASEMENESVVAPQTKVDPWWKRLFAMPAAPMLGATACAMLALFVLVPRERPAATIELLAMRGVQTETQAKTSTAPANAPLILNLSLAGLDNSDPLRIEVADQVGTILRRSNAERSNGRAMAKADGLNAGPYWVRLYSGAKLLREYELIVR